MNLKHRLFWVVSRTSHFLYRHFPIFGPLKAAIGIIQTDDNYLMIERNESVTLKPGQVFKKIFSLVENEL